MKIGIIVAMESEFNLIKKVNSSFIDKKLNGLSGLFGLYGPHEIYLIKSGIGKVNAALHTLELIQNFNPDYIINTGIAGGIDKCLAVMDIVLGQEVSYHDVDCGSGNKIGQVQDLPARYIADNRLLQAAKTYTGNSSVHAGLICSGDQFITNQASLAAIKQNFPDGLAVDMESGAIAQTCYLYQIPFLSVRIISDTPGRTADHAEQYARFWDLAPEKSAEIIQYILSKI